MVGSSVEEPETINFPVEGSTPSRSATQIPFIIWEEYNLTENRFNFPKPAFIPPKDNGLLSPKDQSHHAPSPDVATLAASTGNDKIAAILLRAREAAKEQAKIIESKKSSSSPKKKKGGEDKEQSPIQQI